MVIWEDKLPEKPKPVVRPSTVAVEYAAALANIEATLTMVALLAERGAFRS